MFPPSDGAPVFPQLLPVPFRAVPLVSSSQWKVIYCFGFFWGEGDSIFGLLFCLVSVQVSNSVPGWRPAVSVLTVLREDQKTLGPVGVTGQTLSPS